MSIHLNFITSNELKYKHFRFIASDFLLQDRLIWRKLKYQEPQSNDLEELIYRPLRELYLQIKEPVIIEDTAIIIRSFSKSKGAWGNVPGYETKRWWNEVGLKKTLEWLKTDDDRRAKLISRIGYCDDGKQCHCFIGEVKGYILEKKGYSLKIGKEYPWISPYFFNQVFSPIGTTQSLSTMWPEEHKKYDCRRRAFEKLVAFLSDRYPAEFKGLSMRSASDHWEFESDASKKHGKI